MVCLSKYQAFLFYKVAEMISHQAVHGKKKKIFWLSLSLSLTPPPPHTHTLKHDLISHIVYLYQQLFSAHEMKQLQKLQGCLPLCDANLLTVGTTSRARGTSGGIHLLLW